MNSSSAFLSRASLKDNAKGALAGKYGTFILASFLISIITIASHAIIDFIGTMFFSMFVVIREMLVNHLSLEELQILTQDRIFLEHYTDWYNLLNYVLTLLLNFFTGVFNVGLSLFCLNLACNRTAKVSDIFYGFRWQFGKSLKLTAVFLLVNELFNLPAQILLYLIKNDAVWNGICSTLLLFAACIAVYIPLNLALSQMFLLLLDFPGYSAKELIKLSVHIMKGHKRRLFCLRLSFFPLILLSLLTLNIGNLWLMPYMNMTYTFFFLNLMQARTKNKYTDSDK